MKEEWMMAVFNDNSNFVEIIYTMKKYLTLVLIVITLSSCNFSDDEKVIEKRTVLELKTIRFNETSPECATAYRRGCATLEASYDVLKNEVSDSLNQTLSTINESIYGVFAQAFIDVIPEGNLQLNESPDRFIGSFFKMHRKDQAEFEELIGYEIVNNVNVAHYTNHFVSIEQTIMTYLGGAHPNAIILYKTLDMKSGIEINTYNWLSDTISLKSAILTDIKRSMKMDQNTDLKDKGFFISDQELSISTNILIQKDSVSFMYNNYEIAPYVYGNFNITLPKEIVKMNY